MALQLGSQAIDAGDDSICGSSEVNDLDQRGAARPQGAHCDIGAFETQASAPDSVITITNPENGSTVTPGTKITFKVKVSPSTARVDFYVGTNEKCSDFSAPFICRWNVPNRSGKNYTITANAFDANGKFLGADFSTVTVQ